MIALLVLSLVGAPLEGTRQGSLDVGVKMRLLVKLEKSAEGYSGTLTSLDQSPKPVPFSSVTLAGNTVRLEIAALGAAFEGTLEASGALVGQWKQGGAVLPLTLALGSVAAETKRPQEPVRPFPYDEQEVSFPSAQKGTVLAGTLTLPKGKGPFSAVVLISGSGPQDRDETILRHKPFFVLADLLTRKGIAVLRYDDRGVGKSTGAFTSATTLDFVEDARGAIAFLKKRTDIDGRRLGLIGHSEGALIAPMLASEVSFLLLLAPPAVNGEKIIASQNRVAAKQAGASDADIEKIVGLQAALVGLAKEALPNDKAEAKLRTIFSATGVEAIDLDAVVKTQLPQVQSPWFRLFVRHEPAAVLSRVKVPTLALFGEKDQQVQPSLNKAPLEAALKTARVVLLPGLNHLFQRATTGSPSEYGMIEETIAESAQDEIAKFVMAQGR